MSFVAISKVKYPKSLQEEVQSFGKKMIPLAKSQAGLISISFHQSTDDDETMMYWEWLTKANHEACMKSSDWGKLMEESGELFQSKGIEFSLETYERLA